MMEIDAAKRFAETHFPSGPEKLAEKLGIEVLEGPLTGCDGWVLTGPAGVLIRLNSAAQAKRRRFTLAHELAHLLLGVPTIVGESLAESLRSDSNEERKVNDLASELLLPENVVRKHFSALPVVGAQLQKFAQNANVSALAAATRVANIAASIGLVNGSVAFFKNDHLEWHWSKTLTMSPAEALLFLEKAKKSYPEPARIPQSGSRDVVVASLLKSGFNSAALFIQLLPVDVGNQLAPAELRGQLEKYLFREDNQFRMELQGVLSAFRSQCANRAVDLVVAEFYKQKGQRWDGSRRVRLNSSKGREYIRLRLREWCST
jgi:hypothetical protein